MQHISQATTMLSVNQATLTQVQVHHTSLMQIMDAKYIVLRVRSD